ncbi:MAG: YqeG family HAD IIIA-type phosphatase [Intestinimonas sp.]|nr:YqeG family HAD IIIA-type phosphatase [Intestinimonas sp.]
MAWSLIPDRVYSSIYDIDTEALAEAGVRLMLADLDNTIAPYSVSKPSEAVRTWTDSLRNSGIDLFILSNNRSAWRTHDYCTMLGVPYITHAGKPKIAAFRRAMEQMGRTPAETVMVGDQIFTDVAGAKNAGILILLVRPIRLDNPFRALRYAAEQPFRALGRKRNRA